MEVIIQEVKRSRPSRVVRVKGMGGGLIRRGVVLRQRRQIFLAFQALLQGRFRWRPQARVLIGSVKYVSDRSKPQALHSSP